MEDVLDVYHRPHDPLGADDEARHRLHPMLGRNRGFVEGGDVARGERNRLDLVRRQHFAEQLAVFRLSPRARVAEVFEGVAVSEVW